MKTQNEKKQSGEFPHYWVIKGFPYLKIFSHQNPKQHFLMFFLSLLNISHKPGKKRIQRQIFADQQKTV